MKITKKLENTREMLPEELVTWYILPTARKEVTLYLVKEKGFSQKKTAKLIGLTEGAVSQYMNNLRSMNIELSNQERDVLSKMFEGVKVQDLVVLAKEQILKMYNGRKNANRV